MKQTPATPSRYFADRHRPGPTKQLVRTGLSGHEHTGGIVRTKSVGPILLTEIFHPPGRKLPVHSHQNACFTLVLSGGFQETFGRDSFLCRKETLLYRPSETRHCDEFSPDGARALLIEPEVRWVDSLQSAAQLPNSPRQIGRSPATAVAMQIRAELETPDDLSDLIVTGLVLEMAGYFLRRHREERSHRIPAWLKQARQRLDELSMSPPTISALAAGAHVHPTHLAREFRRFFRCTPGAYVRQMRVAAACRMLEETNLPLLEVADQAGFSNQSHFSRTFRSIMTMTPSQYRANSNR